MKDIRARRFAPVYVLMGEEGYFIDQITEALATTVLTDDEQQFNQFVVYGVDVVAGQLFSMARELPMMAEYKVVIVKEAQTLRSTDEVEKYLDHPSPQTILVYCHKNGTINARSKFITKAKSIGVVFESKKVSEDKLVGYVEDFIKERGKSIDHNTAMAIAASIGSDLCRLSTELDKLCLALPATEQQITPLLVEECVGVSRKYNPFEMIKAVAAHDFVKAYTILDYFDKNSKSGGVFILVPTLFNYFQNLMLAWYAPNRQQRGAVAAYLDLKNEWQAYDYEQGLRHYPAQKVMQIIAMIRQTDEKMKGINATNNDSGDLARELLFFIFN